MAGKIEMLRMRTKKPPPPTYVLGDYGSHPNKLYMVGTYTIRISKLFLVHIAPPSVKSVYERPYISES